jgi:hypothetical protein
VAEFIAANAEWACSTYAHFWVTALEAAGWVPDRGLLLAIGSAGLEFAKRSASTAAT